MHKIAFQKVLTFLLAYTQKMSLVAEISMYFCRGKDYTQVVEKKRKKYLTNVEKMLIRMVFRLLPAKFKRKFLSDREENKNHPPR